MKKLVLIISLVVAGFLKVSANDADLFTYDKSAVQTTLSELSVLESYVVEHPALAIVNVTKTGTVMVNGIELFINPFVNGSEGGPLGIPSFLWGCVFGVAGLLVVYLVTNGDHEQVMKALWGCITITVIGIVVDVIVVAAEAANTN